jgi:hypothetical protein
MKRFLFFIFVIGIGSQAFAQIEFKPQFKAIKPKTNTVKPKQEKDIPPPTNLPKLDIPKIITPNVFKETNIHNSKPKVDNSFEMGLRSGFSMTPTNKFINPGDKVVARLNKKADNEDQIVYRRNQNLGDFKTKSLTAKVTYRDYGEVDGDEIRVLLNEKAIATGIMLDSNFQGFEITLVEGFNKIDFEALTQGRLGPNTAEFQVYDDKGELISASQWNLGTGFKATIIITKE